MKNKQKMDGCEKIAYQYLRTIYPSSDIQFEPEGYKTYPDFICGKNKSEYEVSSLYQNLHDTTVEEYETPIIKKIEAIIKNYNKRKKNGFYYSINIKGKKKINKNNKKEMSDYNKKIKQIPKEVENWFEVNNKKVISLQYESEFLKIKLQPQNKYNKKYISSGIVSDNRGGWVYEEYKNALFHAVDKKSKKMRPNAQLILIDVDMNPLIHEDIKHIDMSHFPFKIIILNQEAKIKYVWN